MSQETAADRVNEVVWEVVDAFRIQHEDEGSADWVITDARGKFGGAFAVRIVFGFKGWRPAVLAWKLRDELRKQLKEVLTVLYTEEYAKIMRTVVVEQFPHEVVILNRHVPEDLL